MHPASLGISPFAFSPLLARSPHSSAPQRVTPVIRRVEPVSWCDALRVFIYSYGEMATISRVSRTLFAFQFCGKAPYRCPPVLLLPRRSSASHFHVADLGNLPASRSPLRTSDDRGGKPTYPRPGREHVRGPLANGSTLLTGTGGIRRDERAENGALFQNR